MENIYLQIDSLFENGLINSLINLVLVAILAIIANKIINTILEKRIPEENKRVIPKKIKKVILITIVILSFFASIKGTKQILGALLASGGVLAVVLGLACQEAASNMINGFMIISYKPYNIGDFVNIIEHNIRGTVKDISIRQSVIETLEGTQVIIPNTIMAKAIIENISNVENQKINYLYIEVSYECNLDQAIQIIQEEASKHPLFVDGRSIEQKNNNVPKVKVHCVEFNDSGIQLRATILSNDNASGFQLLSDLRMSIKARFDQEGIEIPYPHRVVINEKGQ